MTTNVSPAITPHLWFGGRMKEALEFYVSLFPNSSITTFNEVAPGVATAEFALDGQKYMALSSEGSSPFTHAFSFHVAVETQEEVDRYWDALTASGGEESQCGWLVDRFGVSWQIIPNALGECLGDPDPARAQRAMNAMLGMRKIDIAQLQAARAG